MAQQRSQLRIMTLGTPRKKQQRPCNSGDLLPCPLADRTDYNINESAKLALLEHNFLAFFARSKSTFCAMIEPGILVEESDTGDIKLR